MRRIVLGGLLAMALAGAAEAADFVVVSSTDPAVARGQAFDSGAVVPLSPGATAVLIDTAGQVTRLAGRAGGVVLPRRQLADVNQDRVAVLKMLVAPPRVRRTARGLGPTCPEADLTRIDGIIDTARVDGCLTSARAAFEAYVDKALTDAP